MSEDNETSDHAAVSTDSPTDSGSTSPNNKYTEEQLQLKVFFPIKMQ